MTVPRIHSFAAPTFGVTPGPLVISSTHNASVRHPANGGCKTSPAWELSTDFEFNDTTDISGDNVHGFATSTDLSTDLYTNSSGESIPIGFGFAEGEFLPETATYGSLLQTVQSELSAYDALVPRYSSGNLYLYDTYAGVYAVPHSVPALLSGSTSSLGKAALGLHLAASSPNGAYGFTPYTNAQTPHGLPDEEANALTNMSQDNGPPTGGSQTSTAQPTTVLITLAGAGPADVTIPTQAGTQGSGGPPGSGSNLVVIEDATPQGPSMRAAPPEGMIAGAWNSFWSSVSEFFNRDAAVEANEAPPQTDEMYPRLTGNLEPLEVRAFFRIPDAGIWVDFLRHDSGVRWRQRKTPDGFHHQGPDAPSAHRRPGYPLSGCVPAEPDSVSTGSVRLA